MYPTLALASLAASASAAIALCSINGSRQSLLRSNGGFKGGFSLSWQNNHWYSYILSFFPFFCDINICCFFFVCLNNHCFLCFFYSNWWKNAFHENARRPKYQSDNTRIEQNINWSKERKNNCYLLVPMIIVWGIQEEHPTWKEMAKVCHIMGKGKQFLVTA